MMHERYEPATPAARSPGAGRRTLFSVRQQRPDGRFDAARHLECGGRRRVGAGDHRRRSGRVHDRRQGPCTPTPCDWGTRPLTIYGPSAGATVGKAGSAAYNQGFATRIVVVTAHGCRRAVPQVDVYTKFTGTGRSNFVITQTLH